MLRQAESVGAGEGGAGNAETGTRKPEKRGGKRRANLAIGKTAGRLQDPFWRQHVWQAESVGTPDARTIYYN